MRSILSDKVAVITGGGGVICSVMARALAGQGAKCAILDLNLEAAIKVSGEIAKRLWHHFSGTFGECAGQGIAGGGKKRDQCKIGVHRHTCQRSRGKLTCRQLQKPRKWKEPRMRILMIHFSASRWRDLTGSLILISKAQFSLDGLCQ